MDSFLQTKLLEPYQFSLLARLTRLHHPFRILVLYNLKLSKLVILNK
jgi:hypothetical protein